jgi:hypothetical protein
MDIPAEMKALQIKQAVIEDRLDSHFKSEDDFQSKVLKELAYLNNRDIKVFQFIEARMDREKASAQLRQEIVSKLVTSGVWATVVFMGVIAWYAFTQYIHKVP